MLFREKCRLAQYEYTVNSRNVEIKTPAEIPVIMRAYGRYSPMIVAKYSPQLELSNHNAAGRALFLPLEKYVMSGSVPIPKRKLVMTESEEYRRKYPK